jgi:hypothetical protein
MSNPIKLRFCSELAKDFVIHYCQWHGLPSLLPTKKDEEIFEAEMSRYFEGEKDVQRPVDIDALKWNARMLRAMNDEEVIQLMKDLAGEIEKRLEDNFEEGIGVGYDNA